MNLDYLKEFIALAETLNYWEASERLFLNQSTLSKHIKAMETELGVPLFERTTRKVALTEFGAALLPYAQSITRLQFEYSARLLQLRSQQRGLLTIGSIPTMAQHGIIDLLLAFKQRYPDFNTKIIENDSKLLIRQLLDKTCDLIFLRESRTGFERACCSDSDIARIPYINDYMVAVLPKGHPLAGRPEVTLWELRHERFAFINENSMMYDLCRRACQEASFIPDIVFDSHRLDSILDMVAKGGCTALLMNNHIRLPLDPAGREQAPFTAVPITPGIGTQISLCYLKEQPLSKAAATFVEFFQEYHSLLF